MNRVPRLPAQRVGTQLRVWCAYCRRYHRHGGDFGHRAAHCWRDVSPYHATGYVLVPVMEVR